MAAIGIDLGTTFSLVAVQRPGATDVITTDYSKSMIPSIVSYQDDDTLVGYDAENAIADYPDRTIYCVKRLMGRGLDDLAGKQFGYQFTEDENEKIVIQLPGGELKTPEEVSADILFELKTMAERYLGSPVSRAVVTVPAAFNDRQKQATMHAANRAGLQVIRLLQEPTAAAIAYADRHGQRSGKILVYDLGGGTFDAAIIEPQGVDEFKVLGTHGDANLGGEDFDQAMYNLVVDGAAQPPTEKGRALLMRACREAKIKLSTSMTATVNVDGLKVNVSRDDFVEVIESRLQGTITVIDALLDETNLKPSDITDVLLVGGSTHIPRVREILVEKFTAEKIWGESGRSEDVARGAAICAARLPEHKIKLRDVTPHSIGVHTSNDQFCVLIAKGTEYPTNAIKRFQPNKLNLKYLKIEIMEGENPAASNNSLIGAIFLPASAQEDAIIIITFLLNDDGVLEVYAGHEGSEEKKKLTILMTHDSAETPPQPRPKPPPPPPRPITPPPPRTISRSSTTHSKRSNSSLLVHNLPASMDTVVGGFSRSNTIQSKSSRGSNVWQELPPIMVTNPSKLIPPAPLPRKPVSIPDPPVRVQSTHEMSKPYPVPSPPPKPIQSTPVSNAPKPVQTTPVMMPPKTEPSQPVLNPPRPVQPPLISSTQNAPQTPPANEESSCCCSCSIQ